MLKLAIAAITISITSGCATLIRGTAQSVSIDSQPPQATITSNTGPSCTSPCTIKLKRNEDHTITATKPGYRSASAIISSSLDGGGATGMVGNLLTSGPIGMGIDAASGAMYALDPKTLTLVLKRETL